MRSKLPLTAPRLAAQNTRLGNSRGQLQSLEASIAAGDDGFRFDAPDEGLWLDRVVLGDEAADCRLQINDRVEDAVLQASTGKLGKEALDCVHL